MSKKLNWLIVSFVVVSMLTVFGISGCATDAPAVPDAPADAPADEPADAPAETPAETPAAPLEGSITILWAQWAPADNLEELTKDFTAETGIEVILEQEPWETFVQKYNVEMTARSDAWDIIIVDSQDIGNMVVNGHIVELTDFFAEQTIRDRFTEASIFYYSEYPKGSGRDWCLPVEGDALGWAYRKDLFEDPDNMSAFEAEYGYPLDVPSSWDMILDVAKFFHDPDNDFYGVAIYGDNGYDSLAMFAMQTIRAYGGDLGNFETFEVDGYLNSPGAIAGMEYYQELFQYVPPGFGDAFFIHTNDAFVNGIVPMATNYFAFFPALATPEVNPYADVTGYFTSPPQTTVDGTVKQTTALGGQGASIVSYSQKQDLAFAWLEWFARDDTQAKWGLMPGSFTCHIDTLNSQEFLDAWPFNINMKESFEIFEDWWATPQYDEMLRTFSEVLGRYVIAGEGDAATALQTVTEQWEAIYERDGYYDPDFDPEDF